MAKKDRAKYLFVAPGIIWVLLFTMFPLLYSLRLSFFRARLGLLHRILGEASQGSLAPGFTPAQVGLGLARAPSA